MFIIFGWDSTLESIGVVGQGFCFDCRKTKSWIIGKETEWVTFFELRTIPFKSRYHFVCEKCNDNIHLNSKEYREIKSTMDSAGTINGSDIHKYLLARIETQQLADKNETQLAWIRGSLEQEKQELARKQKDT